jgi:hypothetical protein
MRKKSLEIPSTSQQQTEHMPCDGCCEPVTGPQRDRKPESGHYMTGNYTRMPTTVHLFAGEAPVSEELENPKTRNREWRMENGELVSCCFGVASRLKIHEPQQLSTALPHGSP